MNKTIIFILCALIIGCAKEPALEEIKFEGQTMGTSYLVKLVVTADENVPASKDEIESSLQDVLTKLDKKQMSTYSAESELTAFNKFDKTDWFPVSGELARVFEKANEIYQLSGGYFDVTVGPLVNLWGFGPEKRSGQIPSDAEIENRKKQVGQHQLVTRLQPPAIKKNIPEIYCDLSAIAKGFVVDQVADYVESLGIKNYLVEIGGEIRASGKNAKNIVWRIGVASPDNGRGIQKVVQVEHNGMATSGDYMNYFEKDGVRYSHTIDPKTGRPITHSLASVTVLHPSCMMADGFATAINVMGPEKGFAFAQEKKLPVYMILHDGEGFVEKMTPEFETLFAKR